MKTVEEIIDTISGITVIVLFLGGLIAFIIFINNITEEINQVRKEWNDKVNNCVLNENYRKDCKLILYRDAQIHGQQVQDTQTTSAMTGALVGGMVGASLK